MSLGTPVVERVSRTAEWRALENGEIVGTARAQCRPDRRWVVAIDAWRAQVFPVLMQAVVKDLQENLFTTVDEADLAQLERWSENGFVVHRRENEYLIPTDPESTGLQGATLPTGFNAVSAAVADEGSLRALDELLREDVPGSDGWVNDPQQFREYTFDPRHFDPATYLVAVHEPTGNLAGLARVWTGPDRPRLGLIGVVAGYRRRGLARALLAAAFRPLHERGVSEVAAEADATNAASTSLLTSLGAWRTGGTVELLRRHAGHYPGV